MVFKLVVGGLLVAVLIALFSGLYALTKGGANSADHERVIRALTWRVGLSILLFIVLIMALRFDFMR